MASEATVYIMLEDVNDEIPLFTEREQETVLEGEPIGTKVTQVNAIDKDGTFPNNQVHNKKRNLYFVHTREIDLRCWHYVGAFRNKNHYCITGEFFA